MVEERDVDIDDPFWQEVGRLLRAAVDKSRGRNTYWKWPLDEKVAEMEAARVLTNYLTMAGEAMSGELVSVMSDPPDVLLTTQTGRRVGIEVTELVDFKAMREYARQRKRARLLDDWLDWPVAKIVDGLNERIASKDGKLAKARETYDEHLVAIVTDEPAITEVAAREAVARCFPEVVAIARAFLLLSYHPQTDPAVYPDGIVVVPIRTVRLDNNRGR